MAGDWLKVEKSLPDKPEVWQIAQALELDPDAVVGKLIRVWSWFDENTEDGHAPSVTELIIDRYAGVTGFVDAMVGVGWLHRETGPGKTWIVVPNFDRHISESAKRRGLATNRKQKSRALQESRSERDESVTREEKRRGNTVSKRFAPPTVEEVAEYCRERNSTVDPEAFVAFYASKDWKVGNQKMKSWKHAIITWEKRRNEETRRTPPEKPGRLAPHERVRAAAERAARGGEE